MSGKQQETARTRRATRENGAAGKFRQRRPAWVTLTYGAAPGSCWRLLIHVYRRFSSTINYSHLTRLSPCMVIAEKLSEIAVMLRDAALAQDTVPFSKLHSVFDPDVPDRHKYDTLEAASVALAPIHTAIYSALLAKKHDGCPGSGFYDIFRNFRRADFLRIAPHDDLHDLTEQERVKIADEERARVYEHAEGHFGSEFG